MKIKQKKLLDRVYYNQVGSKSPISKNKNLNGSFELIKILDQRADINIKTYKRPLFISSDLSNLSKDLVKLNCYGSKKHYWIKFI